MKIKVFLALLVWIKGESDSISKALEVKAFGSKKQADNQIAIWKLSEDSGNIALLKIIEQEIEVDLFYPDKPIFYHGEKKK